MKIPDDVKTPEQMEVFFNTFLEGFKKGYLENLFRMLGFFKIKGSGEFGYFSRCSECNTNIGATFHVNFLVKDALQHLVREHPEIVEGELPNEKRKNRVNEGS